MIGLSAALAAPARADPRPGLDEFQAGRFSEAVQAWRAAAQQGDAAAALFLGVIYDTGAGVAPDERQALGWYERAGNGGNPTAMFNAAVLHEMGRGAAADPRAAIEWYERAAQAGSGRAAYNLGGIYEQGLGVPADRAKAVRMYRVAAGRGITAARARLTALGVAGTVVRPAPAPDPAMASFEQAQSLLLVRGTAASQQAATLFRRAAEGGNALAAYNLAYSYEHGIGVSPNLEQAVVWYGRSAANATDPALREMASAGLRHVSAPVSPVQR